MVKNNVRAITSSIFATALLIAGLALAPHEAAAQIAKNVAAKSPWGPTDEIGTLNMMTDDSRFDVLKQIAGGKVYDLGVDLFVGMPICCAIFGDPTFQIFLTHAPSRGDPAKELLSYSGDGVTMYTHSGTHIDALNHFGLHGKIWNEVAASDDLGVRGWTKSGVDKYPPIVARGVLIDVAKSKNMAQLAPSYAITVADLKDALKKQGTTLRPGDVVLIRTGMMSLGRIKPSTACSMSRAWASRRPNGWSKARKQCCWAETTSASRVCPRPTRIISFRCTAICWSSAGSRSWRPCGSKTCRRIRCTSSCSSPLP